MYRFSVHNFSDKSSASSTALANSDAKVVVQRGSTIIATYYVPNKPGTLWTVFEMNGTAITPVNTISYESLSYNIRGTEAETDAELIRDLPEK